MAFTAEEMAVLSQMAYSDIQVTDEEERPLYDIILELEESLKESLGDGYSDIIDGLKEKVKGEDYIVVHAENDKYDTGFSAFAVKDPNNEVTIACRGTEGFDVLNSEDSRRDVYTDINIGLSSETNQQQKLEEFIEYLEKKEYDGYYFTGHSLGGNLAVHGAVSCGDANKVKGVVTFNAPGFNVSYWVVHGIKIRMLEGKILNYENEYDYVSSIFKSPGETIYVESVYSDDDYGFNHHYINGIAIDSSGSFKKTDKKGKRTLITLFVSNGLIDTVWSLGIIGRYLHAKFTGGSKIGFRDFSESALQMMTAAAKEVEEEEWWDITRWDCWYRMDQLMGSWVMDYQLLSGDVDSYYRKIIDINDASVAEIKAIFNNVRQIDDNFASSANGLVSSLNSRVLTQLEKLRDSIVPNT